MKIADLDNTREIIAHLTHHGYYSEDLISSAMKGFTFYEFDLNDLGFPEPQELLAASLAVKNQIGLQGWTTKFGKSRKYSGFSLTYNPDYTDTNSSKFHQTWGSSNLIQNVGRQAGMGQQEIIRNSYYDTFAFRKIDPLIEKYFGRLFSKLDMPILRSRVAFLNMFGKNTNESPSHVDEPPVHLMRLNIPLQTSEEFVIKIEGEDGYGNSLNLTKHLKVGKAYIWNTRIPHKVTVNQKCTYAGDRIHIVLGLGTWITYDPKSDNIEKSHLHGRPLRQIVEEKLFLKN